MGSRIQWGTNLGLCVNPPTQQQLLPPLAFLAAAAGAAAAHAAVAASIADHDGPAGMAAGGVAHVVEAFHGVGGVVDASVLHVELAAGLADGSELGQDSSLRCAGVAHALWLKATGTCGARYIVWIPRLVCGFAQNDTLRGSGFKIGRRAC